jgi:lysophospholipase L1-like esterase
LTLPLSSYRRPSLSLAAAFCLFIALTWAQDKAADPTRWEKAIAAFEQQDRDKPPPKDGILFVGSSSIRLWDLAKSFPGLPVINRGFGGSQIGDAVHFARRLVTKHRPRMVVFYAGDNDIAAGKTPEKVAADFQAFVKLVHQELPKTRIVFLAVKPSLARWKLYEKQKQANALVEAYCRKGERLRYVDLVKPMLGDDVTPRAELFVKDGLHLSAKGYEVWTAAVKPHLK